MKEVVCEFWLILVSNIFFPFVSLPHAILLQTLGLGTYLSARAVVCRPRTDNPVNIHLSVPRSPADITEFERCRRDDDDSPKPTWQKETFQ